ncbi:hypothetical protein [Nannocystis bainbridge]|uniref:Uncharacterized protein n=1 Tax=Nannocystis bainbridge TaxID=2995303 RepID=A0ABT5E203_9BACT|nr:hypothetical protein [Nannocystis bainbridge]MDC0719906.1 hypothetical protein [Nannocystis bainbridge]
MRQAVYLTLSFITPFACGSAPRATDAPAQAQAAPAAAVPPSEAPAPTTPQDCASEPGMVFIAGGDTVYSEDRKTYHVDAFWLDRTEVTVAPSASS